MWAIAGGAVVVMAAVIVALLVNAGGSDRPGQGFGQSSRPTPGNDPHATPTPTPSPAALLGGPPNGKEGTYPTEILYSEDDPDSARLHRLDLRTGEDRVLLEAPAAGILTAPVGDYAAYKTLRTEDGREVRDADGAPATPVLHVVNLETGEDETFEDVSDPWWSWDGERLLVSRAGADPPAIGTLAVDETEVRPLELPPAAKWVPMGWAEDRVLMFKYPEEALFLASRDGALEPVATPDGVIRLDPSPEGRYVLATSHEDDAVFQPLDGGRPTVVDLEDWIFGVTKWARNDLVFGAVATSKTEDDAPSVVLVLDPGGSSWEVPNTADAVRAIPTPDGEGFVLVRGHTGEHRLWACLLDGTCRRVPGTVPLGSVVMQVG